MEDLKINLCKTHWVSPSRLICEFEEKDIVNDNILHKLIDEQVNKEECEKNKFVFEEYQKNKWNNILSTLKKINNGINIAKHEGKYYYQLHISDAHPKILMDLQDVGFTIQEILGIFSIIW